jgi:hypothetical protein
MIDLFINSPQNTIWNGREISKRLAPPSIDREFDADIPPFQPFPCALSDCHTMS